MLKLKLITPPAVEPVTLEEAKLHLRLDASDCGCNGSDSPCGSDDEDIIEMIVAAREYCEDYQNRSYVLRTYELALDEWPRADEIRLPRPPLRSVDYVMYNDQSWDESRYLVDDFSFIPRIVKVDRWPNERLPKVNGIRIRYIAGYEPKGSENIEGETIGTGKGIEQTYELKSGPIKPGSLVVYFDGEPTTDFRLCGNRKIICTPGNGVVVTADYESEVDYTANIPSRVKRAILLLVGHWYENREAVLIGSISKELEYTVHSLLSVDRVVPI